MPGPIRCLTLSAEFWEEGSRAAGFGHGGISPRQLRRMLHASTLHCPSICLATHSHGFRWRKEKLKKLSRGGDCGHFRECKDSMTPFWRLSHCSVLWSRSHKCRKRCIAEGELAESGEKKNQHVTKSRTVPDGERKTAFLHSIKGKVI